MLQAGGLVGAWAHLAEADQALTQVDLLVQEAMTSSAIEGEYLDRASVQSSVRRAFGMTAEAGAARGKAALPICWQMGFADGTRPP